jgi:hypothetical protein
MRNPDIVADEGARSGSGRYYPTRFELFLLNEKEDLAPIPRFHPNSKPIQKKYRPTVMSSGLFLLNAPKEICSELFTTYVKLK